MLAAVQVGQPVTFDYRRSPPSDVMTRTVEPWGVVSWRGRWYLVGRDRDRDAARCFRLTRVVGEVRTVGPPGEVERPAGINLLEYVVGTQQEARPTTTAKLWVARGRAQGVRRQATVTGTRDLDGQPGDEVTVELHFPDSAAGWLAGRSVLNGLGSANLTEIGAPAPFRVIFRQTCELRRRSGEPLTLVMRHNDVSPWL